MNATRVRREIWWLAAVSFMTCAVVFALDAAPKERLRACGHPQDFQYRIKKLTGVHFGAFHCCAVNSMYLDLKMIDAEQEIYRTEHGQYAARLEDLKTVLHLPIRWKIELKANIHEWQAVVPAQGIFPGNYLVRGGERMLEVHFNSNGPATTNDLLLWRQ